MTPRRAGGDPNASKGGSHRLGETHERTGLQNNMPPARPRFTIGGSDAAAAAGIDPYRSRVMLWAEKSGRIERPESEAMAWGKRLEPLVYAAVAERGYEVLPAPADGFADANDPWFVGHPDGFTVLHDERAVLEVKTAGAWAWGERSDVPVQYQAQCQHYMRLTDTRHALVACLVGGQRLELHELRRDDAAIATLRLLELDMYEHLRRDTPPPPDGSDSSRDALRQLYPEHEGGKVHRLTRDEWVTVRALRARRAQRAAIDEQVSELENVLKAAMQDAELALSPHDEEVLHWRNYQARRLDTAALKEARPDVYGEFATVTTTRRFTVL